jgi:Na(+)-translocating NADH:ubiquinone oxidoreductase A subunit
MEAIHKSFAGGYKFGIFEGQPSKEIRVFKPAGDVVSVAIELDGVANAANVLDTLGRTGFEAPVSARVNTEGTIEPSKVKNIVVSTVEVEPYNLSNEAILSGDNKRKFIDGLKSIHISYDKAKITLVLGNNQKELIAMITQETKMLTWVDIAKITAKYPANLKELSIPTILGNRYPVGYAPAHIGVLFLSVMDVIHVNKAVNEKKKIDTTYVSLSGTGWKENVILEVPVGTSVREIKDAYLSDHEIRLIKNSVLTQDVFEEDEIVDFDTSVMIALPEDRKRQILFFLRAGKNADSISNSFLSSLLPKAAKTSGTNLHGERRPCVSCTYCQKVCPVGLIPHLLHKHVDKEIINKRLAEYKIFNCIECGLCDYVCPSKIEISSDIKRGKVMLEANGISHNDYVIPYCDMVQEVKEVEPVE